MAAQLLKEYRRGINPPYRKKDFVLIFGTIFILIAIPATVYLAGQDREPISRAAGPAKVLDCFPDNNQNAPKSSVGSAYGSGDVAVVPPAAYDGAILKSSSIEDQTVRAEQITIGKVTKVSSRVVEGSIVTDVKLGVERTLKGGKNQKTLTITIEGGQVGDRCLYVGGVPNFLVNERVLLFLKNKDNNPRLVQLWQSKYSLAGGDAIQPEAEKPRMSIKKVEERVGKTLGKKVIIGSKLENVVSSDFTIFCEAWTQANLPVPYEVNPANPGSGGAIGNDFLRLTYNAWHSWQGLSDSYPAFTLTGSTSNPGSDHFDYFNTAAWANLGSGILGTNYCATIGGQRVDSDTLISNNTAFSWDSDESVSFGSISLISTMEHELGHGLGLGHSNAVCDGGSTTPLMCPSLSAGVRKTIKPDDQAGAAFRYPLSGIPPSAPSSLSVSPGASSNNISWIASVGSPIAYDIERSGNSCSDPFSSIQTVASTVTSYLDNNLGDGLVPGDYCYRIKAIGIGGDSAYVSQNPPDIEDPAVSITNPAGGATVSGLVSVTASASDNIGVTKVEFYVDGTLKSTDTASPYAYSWDTTTVSNGNYTLLAKAYDGANNIGTSSQVTVTVDNQSPPVPPTVDIKANGSNGPITIGHNTAATLSWTSTNANSCTASGAWSGSKNTSGSQSTGNLSGPNTYTYTLTCTGNGGTGSDSVAVSVSGGGTPAAPTVDIKAGGSNGPITIVYNQKATLSWSSTNSTSCIASGAWSGGKSTSGSQSTGRLTSSKTYTLTCTGVGGTKSDSVVVKVAKKGDLNKDGKIDIFDLSILLSRWGKTSTTADINASGKVDIFDLSIFLSRWGR